MLCLDFQWFWDATGSYVKDVFKELKKARSNLPDELHVRIAVHRTKRIERNRGIVEALELPKALTGAIVSGLSEARYPVENLEIHFVYYPGRRPANVRRLRLQLRGHPLMICTHG